MANFAVVLLVSSVALAGAVNSDSDHAGMMRRHNDVVQLNAGGDLKIVATPADKKAVPEVTAKLASKVLSSVEAQVQTANENRMKSKTKNGDLCDCNFAHGTDKTNDCAHPETQQHMEEPGECEAAAELACPDRSCIGHSDVTHTLTIDSEWFSAHPKRCYIDTVDNKWYFNPSGFTPDVGGITSGTPICVQKEYIDGAAADSNDCGNDEYENILDEESCRTAATCQNICTYDEFRVLDEHEEDGAPKGCHKSPNHDGCVRFNKKEGTPSDPKGTVMCEIKGSGLRHGTVAAQGQKAAPTTTPAL